MQTRTLLLTPWFVPLRILRWQDAITMLYLEKAETIVAYDQVVRSPSRTIALPAVIRAFRQLKHKPPHVKFSRINVYARDHFKCQYCGKGFTISELTFDHVVPRFAGGRTEWTNIVAACKPCNNKKGHRTCDEASMWPLQTPVRPSRLPKPVPLVDAQLAPAEWQGFLVNSRG